MPKQSRTRANHLGKDMYPAREKLLTEQLTKFPDIPSSRLAKMMVETHPKLFPNMDAARTAVRRLRGRQGAYARTVQSRHDQRFMLPPPSIDNPFSMPETSMRAANPYMMAAGRTLVFGDVHIPYHNVKALTLMLHEAQARDVDAILINGDLLDCHTLSRFEKNPEARDMNDELTLTRQFLSSLRTHFPRAKIIYKAGNHDMHMQRYLSNNAPALIKCSEFRIDVLLRLHEYNIDFVEDKRTVKFGQNLTVYHGHELGIGSAVVPARTARMKTGTCCITAHHHRTSEDSFRDGDGRIVTCWSIGCMCDLAPEWMLTNQWNLGFAIVDLEKGGDFIVSNKRVIPSRKGLQIV